MNIDYRMLNPPDPLDSVPARLTGESVAQLRIRHPELVSGSKNRIILDAETSSA
ncbi:MAG: hypothetical protein KKF20_06045 [Bacteroidetes bacterium]|nr:hypothetical protein [Bacteroidota bacterium]